MRMLPSCRASPSPSSGWPGWGSTRQPARRRIRSADIDDEKRLAIAVGAFLGAPRSLGDREALGIGDDEDGVTITHVPFGTLLGSRARCFPQRRIFTQEARLVRKVLGPAALPATPGHAALDRNIERCAIYAGLSAADDLHGASLRNRVWSTIAATGKREVLSQPDNFRSSTGENEATGRSAHLRA
jgi:hypothetical protein